MLPGGITAVRAILLYPSLPLLQKQDPTPLLQHTRCSILSQCLCIAAFFVPGPLMYAVHRKKVCHGGLGWAS